MENKRQLQVAKMLQKELADVFQKDARTILGNDWITITQIRMTADLGIAYVHVSFLLSKNKKLSLEILEENNKYIRQLLAQRIKNSVRSIPILQFFLDDSLEYATKMDELLDTLEIPPADEMEEE